MKPLVWAGVVLSLWGIVMSNNGIQTISQQRAKFALNEVTSIVDSLVEKDHDEWLSRANEIPAMIQMNGFGQTMAFYLSKGGMHKKMYDLIAKWLCNEAKIYEDSKSSKIDLMKKITESNMQTYRIAQAEAQALLLWVKKFSKAYCKED